MLFENTIITVISLSTPLIIAVIGETISEKSGVINLSAEGTIMISALAGFAFGYITDIAFIGFLDILDFWTLVSKANTSLNSTLSFFLRAISISERTISVSFDKSFFIKFG